MSPTLLYSDSNANLNTLFTKMPFLFCRTQRVHATHKWPSSYQTFLEHGLRTLGAGNRSTPICFLFSSVLCIKILRAATFLFSLLPSCDTEAELSVEPQSQTNEYKNFINLKFLIVIKSNCNLLSQVTTENTL